MGYTGKLDEKKRVTVPAKLRKGLDGELKIRKDFSNLCLILSTSENWNKELNKIKAISIRFEAEFKQNSFNITLDGKNRILLPQSLLSMIGIEEKGEIEFRVSENCVELWKKQ